MSQRVTIVIDDDINKKLHQIQANAISKTSQSVSFSRVLNMELRKLLN